MSFVVYPSSMPTDENLIGSKAANMARTAAAGFPVPAFAVLSFEFYERFILGSPEVKRILDNTYYDTYAKAVKLHKLLSENDFPSEAAQHIEGLWASLSAKGKKRLVLRMSFPSPSNSRIDYRGLSYYSLNLRDKSAFCQALSHCYAERFSTRLMEMLLPAVTDPFKVPVAVIVQELIDAESSGILFTTNPLVPDCEEIFVQSVWGLGEGLAGGNLEADTFSMERYGKIKKQTIALKTKLFIPLSRIGTAIIQNKEKKRLKPSLSKSMLKTVYRTALKLENLYGRPVEAEFCFKGSHIYLLQADNVPGLDDSIHSKYHLNAWSNRLLSPYINPYLLPLEYSLFQDHSSRLLKSFFLRAGVPESVEELSEQYFTHMTASFRGWTYFNWKKWEKTVSEFPGALTDRPAVLERFGLKDKVRYTLKEPWVSIIQRIFVHFPKLLRTWLKLLSLSRKALRKTDAALVKFKTLLDDFSTQTAASKNSSALFDLFLSINPMLMEYLSNFGYLEFSAFRARNSIIRFLEKNYKGNQYIIFAKLILYDKDEPFCKEFFNDLEELLKTISENAAFKSDLLKGKLSAETPETIQNRGESGLNLTALYEKYKSSFSTNSGLLGQSAWPDLRAFLVFLERIFRVFARTGTLLTIKDHKADKKELNLTLREDLWIIKRIYLSRKMSIMKKALELKSRMAGLYKAYFRSINVLFDRLGSAWANEGFLTSQQMIQYLTLEEIKAVIHGGVIDKNIAALTLERNSNYSTSRNLAVQSEWEAFRESGFAAAPEQTGIPASMPSPISAMVLGIEAGQGRVIKIEDLATAYPEENSVLCCEYLRPGSEFLIPFFKAIIIENIQNTDPVVYTALKTGKTVCMGCPGIHKALKTNDGISWDPAVQEIHINRSSPSH